MSVLYEDAPVTEVGFEWVDGLRAKDRSWKDSRLMKDPNFDNVGWVRGVEARLALRAFAEGRSLTVRSEDVAYDWVLRALPEDGTVTVLWKANNEVRFSTVGVFTRGECEAVVSALTVKKNVSKRKFRVLYAPPHTMVSRNSGASAFVQRRK